MLCQKKIPIIPGGHEKFNSQIQNSNRFTKLLGPIYATTHGMLKNSNKRIIKLLCDYFPNGLNMTGKYNYARIHMTKQICRNKMIVGSNVKHPNDVRKW